MSEQRRSPSGALGIFRGSIKASYKRRGHGLRAVVLCACFAGKQEGSFEIFERCFVAFHIVNNAPVV